MEPLYYAREHKTVQSMNPPPFEAHVRDDTRQADTSGHDKLRETRRRTKTGCLTCRKRRIKCDEGKPDCLRCVKSKRPCEGYNAKTVFRNESQHHYQQSIRPSPATSTTGNKVNINASSTIQFSIPQYQNSLPNSGSSLVNPHSHTTIFSSGSNEHINDLTSQLGNKSQAAFESRNSSASNASGVSANSEQRRISVLSLISSDTSHDHAAYRRLSNGPTSQNTLKPIRPTVREARDNFFYNYYVSFHARTLARSIPTSNSVNVGDRGHPIVAWPQVVPSLINDDPPGRRALFDAVVAYTAHIKFDEIPIDSEIRSSGAEARLLELALKSFTDIIRGRADMLSKVDTIFEVNDNTRVMIRWALLQHIVISIMSDTNPRVPWVNYLCAKVYNTPAYLPSNEVQKFFLAALGHISSCKTIIPYSIMEFRHTYGFLSPEIAIIYFAFIRDFEALKNIAYNELSDPKLEHLYLTYRMVDGARLREESDLGHLATELLQAMRRFEIG